MSGLATVRRRLLAASVWFTKWVGHQHSPWTRKHFSGAHYHRLKATLEQGDVLMSKTNGELTNLFIPGFWSHGAVYVGDGWVVEAIGEGVVLTDLVTWALSKDYVRAMRPKFATKEEREFAAAWCVSKVGALYDYEFSSDNAALYCFELTFACYQEAMHEESPWELRLTLGVPTVVGDDFDKATDKWRRVWDSRDWRVTRVNGRTALEATRP